MEFAGFWRRNYLLENVAGVVKLKIKYNMVSYLIGYAVCYVLSLVMTLIDEKEIVLSDLFLGLLISLTSWFGVILFGLYLLIYSFAWLSERKVFKLDKVIFKLKRK